MSEAWIDAGPTSGWLVPLCNRACSASRATSTGPIFAMASTPRSEREPCAATPLVSISNATNPRCATASCSSVGSTTIAASAWTRSSTASVPTEPSSSSATRVRTTSPRTSPTVVAATIAAASAPFMSYAPRPYKRPSSTRGSSGPSMPPNPTVSKCPLSRSERPPPVPRRTATTLGRSSPTISVSRPWSSHQFATSAAASPSPRPPGTSDGLTESTETSRVARSTISSRRSTTRRLVLRDPEERRAGRRAPVPGGVDRDNAVAKLPAGELRRHPPTHLGIAGADEEPPRRDEGREQCVLLVHADDGSAPAAVVEQVEAQRGLLPALGVGGVRGDERRSDVGRFEVADCGEMLDRGRRTLRERVGAGSVDVQRAQHFLRGRRRPAAVVVTEPGRHRNEQGADVPEAELDAEEVRVVGGLAEEHSDRAQVGHGPDQRDLHSVSVGVDGVDRLLKRSLRGSARLAVRKEDVLLHQRVARGIAVRACRAGHQACDHQGKRHSAEGMPGRASPRPRAAVAASDHWEQVVGCGLSMRSPVVGVPPGTTNVTVSTASAFVLFLTMNVLAPVS